MAKRRKIILLTTAALAVVLVGLWLFIRREPCYDGRSLSEWADMGLRATDQEPWNTSDVLVASNAIRQIGIKSFPWIRNAVLKKDSTGIRVLSRLDWSSSIGDELRRVLAKPLILRTERTCFIFYSLSEQALPLIDELSNSNTIFSTSYIECMGPRALPALIPLLANSPSDDRTDLALRFVRLWGTNAFAAGPHLWSVVETNHRDANESRWLSALASTGYRAEEFSKMLVAHIRSDAKPPDYAKHHIWALGRVPGWAAPALVSLLEHPQPEVQRRALLSLFGETIGRARGAPTPYFRMQPYSRMPMSSGPLRDAPSLLNPSSSNALREASVSIRLQAVQLALQSHAGRSSNSWYLQPSETEAFIGGFTNDPSETVVAEARKAIEGLRLLEKP